MKNENENINQTDSYSSAEGVELHLQTLESVETEARYYSQEQPFSSDELTSIINEERLNELMTQSDVFLS
ncbi:MAG: hypothetical protein L0J53_09600, partial [Psychrobacter sp.]|nr:hypothetical protein [Psychrobacter sp.]